jgi:hypothetical protein
MSLEEMEKSPENAIINKQDTTVFEGQNISSTSTVNTTENTSSSDINQKTMNDDADNNKTLAATTTNKPISRNNVENFFTQIGEAVKKFFGDN